MSKESTSHVKKEEKRKKQSYHFQSYIIISILLSSSINFHIRFLQSAQDVHVMLQEFETLQIHGKEMNRAVISSCNFVPSDHWHARKRDFKGEETLDNIFTRVYTMRKRGEKGGKMEP